MFTEKLYKAIMRGELSKAETQVLFALILGSRSIKDIRASANLSSDSLTTKTVRSLSGAGWISYDNAHNGRGKSPYSTIKLHLE